MISTRDEIDELVDWQLRKGRRIPEAPCWPREMFEIIEPWPDDCWHGDATWSAEHGWGYPLPGELNRPKPDYW